MGPKASALHPAAVVLLGCHSGASHNRLQPLKIFPWFVEHMTDPQQMRGSNPRKTLLADIFKLLRNSAYRKMLEAVERQTNIIYTTDENVMDRVL